MSVHGAEVHLARLCRMREPASRKLIGAAIFAGADDIKTQARQLITFGAVSGKGHVRSLPGQPPKADTHHLDTNIEAVRTGELKAQVESRAEYALALEKGTSKMAARPYMVPATAMKRRGIVERVHKVLQRIIR